MKKYVSLIPLILILLFTSGRSAMGQSDETVDAETILNAIAFHLGDEISIPEELASSIILGYSLGGTSYVELVSDAVVSEMPDCLPRLYTSINAVQEAAECVDLWRITSSEMYAEADRTVENWKQVAVTEGFAHFTIDLTGHLVDVPKIIGAITGTIHLVKVKVAAEDALVAVTNVAIANLGYQAAQANYNHLVNGTQDNMPSRFEPCVAFTNLSNSVIVRVGPGSNRSSISFLATDVDVPVIGKTEIEGIVWWKVDKSLAAPGKLIDEAWIPQNQVMSRGDCDLVEEVNLLPIVAIPTQVPTSEPDGDSSGSQGSIYLVWACDEGDIVNLPQGYLYHFVMSDGPHFSSALDLISYTMTINGNPITSIGNKVFSNGAIEQVFNAGSLAPGTYQRRGIGHISTTITDPLNQTWGPETWAITCTVVVS